MRETNKTEEDVSGNGGSSAAAAAAATTKSGGNWCTVADDKRMFWKERREKKIDEKTLHRPGEDIDSPLFLKLLRSNLSFDDLASEIENDNYKLDLNVFVTLEF